MLAIALFRAPRNSDQNLLLPNSPLASYQCPWVEFLWVKCPAMSPCCTISSSSIKSSVLLRLLIAQGSNFFKIECNSNETQMKLKIFGRNSSWIDSIDFSLSMLFWSSVWISIYTSICSRSPPFYLLRSMIHRVLELHIVQFIVWTSHCTVSNLSTRRPSESQVTETRRWSEPSSKWNFTDCRIPNPRRTSTVTTGIIHSYNSF